MSITLDDLAFLASEAGARVLDRLAGDDVSEAHTLALLSVLRRDHSATQAGAALELARLRLKARAKFGDDAACLYFTADALEQASDPQIRRWRGMTTSADTFTIDLCCGIGSDALAFAAHSSVLAVELDPVRAQMARLNAEALGVPMRVITADVRDHSVAADTIFFDPARRTLDGKRIHDVNHYLPPLNTLHQWLAARMFVKLSPGVDLAQLAGYGRAGGYVEFISVEGDLKEAMLGVFGSAADINSPLRVQARLFADHAMYVWGHADEPAEAPLDLPRAWLVEPDPALIRAGLVQDAALKFNGAMLDETIAYFTTDVKPESPWVRAWRVLEWMPFSVKRLRAALRERYIGTVTVKKRGSAVTPEALTPQLKLKGENSCVVVLTRARGAQIALICEDYRP